MQAVRRYVRLAYGGCVGFALVALGILVFGCEEPIELRIISRTEKSIWVTPAGRDSQGQTYLLPLVRASWPHLLLGQEGHLSVVPGETLRLVYEGKHVRCSDLIIEDASGKMRHTTVSLQTRPGRRGHIAAQEIVIDQVDSLSPASPALRVIAVDAQKPSRLWLVYVFAGVLPAVELFRFVIRCLRCQTETNQSRAFGFSVFVGILLPLLGAFSATSFQGGVEQERSMLAIIGIAAVLFSGVVIWLHIRLVVRTHRRHAKGMGIWFLVAAFGALGAMFDPITPPKEFWIHVSWVVWLSGVSVLYWIAFFHRERFDRRKCEESVDR